MTLPLPPAPAPTLPVPVLTLDRIEYVCDAAEGVSRRDTRTGMLASDAPLAWIVPSRPIELDPSYSQKWMRAPAEIAGRANGAANSTRMIVEPS
jgi:hypothetical protein